MSCKNIHRNFLLYTNFNLIDIQSLEDFIFLKLREHLITGQYLFEVMVYYLMSLEVRNYKKYLNDAELS